jgi:serine phosphatase RsbU (regulator of sigma subunit)
LLKTYSIAVFDISTAIVLLVAQIYLRITKDFNTASLISFIALLALFSFLASSGGHDGSALFWLFIFPATVFFVRGIVIGLIFVLILFIVSQIIFYGNLSFCYNYPDWIKHTFNTTYLTVSAFAFSYELYRQKSQNLIVESKKEIAERNEHITQSINYAKLIQDAILPDFEKARVSLKDSFLIYLPKDIVSGDFYWHHKTNDFEYFVVSDCTGHGVPGAFMSMIGITLLNDLVKTGQVSSPAEILEKLNAGVEHVLQQEGKESYERQDDGMDITICRIDRTNKNISVASANQYFYIQKSDNQLVKIKGDPFSIGSHYYTTVSFNNHLFSLNEIKKIYMFSDGFVDQFGGEKSGKFMGVRFFELIKNNKDLPMEEQKNIYLESLKAWMNSGQEVQPQIDDITVFGIVL